MTKNEKLFLIDKFVNTFFEKNLEIYFMTNDCREKFDIDRFLLKDICHLLNQYKREIRTNDISENKITKTKKSHY